MVSAAIPPWDAAVVRRWIESRIAAARADQVSAARQGRGAEDDCDKAAAEEMVCTALRSERVTETQAALAAAIAEVAARDLFLWRGVHDDDRFDRHVRTTLRKLARMTKRNEDFGNVLRYQ